MFRTKALVSLLVAAQCFLIFPARADYTHTRFGIWMREGKKQVITISLNGEITTWDADSQKKISIIKTEHLNAFRCAYLSSDGAVMGIAFMPAPFTTFTGVQAVSLPEEKVIRFGIPVPGERFKRYPFASWLDLSKDNRILYAGYKEEGVVAFRLWDGKILWRLPSLAPQCFVVSEDGRWLAGISSDGCDKRLAIFNAKTGLLEKEISKVSEDVTTISSRSGSKSLFCGTASGLVQEWSLSGELMFSRRFEDRCIGFFRFCDTRGRILVQTDRDCSVLDLSEGELKMTTSSGRIQTASLSADGQYLCIGSLDPVGNAVESVLQLYDVDKGELIREIRPGGYEPCAAFTPDGHSLFTIIADQLVKIDVGTGRVLRGARGQP